MIGVFALMFALQVLVVQFGGAMFRTVPLPIDMWLKIIAGRFRRGGAAGSYQDRQARSRRHPRAPHGQ